MTLAIYHTERKQWQLFTSNRPGLSLWLSPRPSGSSAVGHCHPAQKHALRTGCSSPPAPSLRAQGRVVGAGRQHKDKASSALLLREQRLEGSSAMPAGRNPALGISMGLSPTAESQLNLGRAGKDVVSSHLFSSPTSRGEVSAESGAERADADRDSLKALCGCSLPPPRAGSC